MRYVKVKNEYTMLRETVRSAVGIELFVDATEIVCKKIRSKNHLKNESWQVNCVKLTTWNGESVSRSSRPRRPSTRQWFPPSILIGSAASDKLWIASFVPQALFWIPFFVPGAPEYCVIKMWLMAVSLLNWQFDTWTITSRRQTRLIVARVLIGWSAVSGSLLLFLNIDYSSSRGDRSQSVSFTVKR